VDVVILAGGVGRRFGGQKQFTEVGPQGETLLEITLADAHRAGCRRGILVVSPEGEAELGARFRARPVTGMEIVLAVQRMDDLPARPDVARDKPWGTAHALWAARHEVSGPFLLFNADDHYGPQAPAILMSALATPDPEPAFAMLGYPLTQTLSSDGAVSRAVIETDPSGYLSGLCEHTDIDANCQVMTGKDAGLVLPPETLVSMNAWAFTPAIFPLLEAALQDFLSAEGLDRAECFLPTAVDQAVRRGEARVRVAPTRDKWFGLTWPGDTDRVKVALKDRANLAQVLAQWGLEPEQGTAIRWGTGLIHQTWRWDSPQGAYVLQRLNGQVFPDPSAVAENAAVAARRVDAALAATGDDDPRHRLRFLPGPNGRPWVRDVDGDVWRAAGWIADSRPANPASLVEIRSAAEALGRFPGLVANGVGQDPAPVLPGFHDTPARLNTFTETSVWNPMDRGRLCIDETMRLLQLAHLSRRVADQDLPERPVHNDAKVDNVLVDKTSGEALCVIDLDTVMPGLAAHDFGDLVRSLVSGRPEDEPELALIDVREDVFEAVAVGYVAGARGWLTPLEKASLVDGALVMTFEQALRFLTDYLTGDVYYQVQAPGHNLQRARAQIRLLDRLLEVEAHLKDLVSGL